MIDIVVVLISIGVLIFASHFFSWVFSHTQIPDPLLLIIVGLLIGPVFGLLDPSFFGAAGELAVILVLVILLFQSGIGLKWSAVRSSWTGTTKLSVTSFVMTMLLVGFVLWQLFDLEPILAFMVGSIVGGTSSAVVIPLLRHLTLGEAARVELTLESVFSDVLAIVVTIGLLEAHQSGAFSIFELLNTVLLSFAGAAVIGVGVGLLWARLLTAVRHMQNSLFTTPALVFVLFGLVEQIGLSGPIAALAFGVLMGNIPQLNNYLEQRKPWLRYALLLMPLSRREKLFFGELVFLMQTFFFVFVGLSMRLGDYRPLVIGLALVVLLALMRPFMVRLVMPRSLSVHDATVMAVMVPKGLAAAALASLPLQQGIASGLFIQDVTYAIILASVIVTSLLVFAIHRSNLVRHYALFLAGFGQDHESVFDRSPTIL